MAHLKLFVLGAPRVEHDGQPLELNLRKALALLVDLAVSNQPQTRDALATLLWPDSDGREGRAPAPHPPSPPGGDWQPDPRQPTRDHPPESHRRPVA